MSVNPQFSKLFQPGQIGRMELRNRIVMPAMLTALSSNDGYVTQRLKNFHEARARGGVGLIIVETSYVHSSGHNSPIQLSISDDKFIPGLSELAQVIQRHGAKAAIQLSHGGRRAPSKFTGVQPIAPSPIPCPGYEMPKEVTVEEIAGVVEYFAEAARRAYFARLALKSVQTRQRRKQRQQPPQGDTA